MKTWKRIKRALPIIGIALLAYIIINSGPERILDAIYSVNPLYFLPATIFVIPYFILQTYKWKYILDKQKMGLGFLYLFRLYLIGTFYSTLTPGRLGTFIRIGYLKEKTGRRLGECSSNVILDKATDILAIFVMAIVGIALFAGYMLDMMLITITFVFLLLFIVGVLFFTKREVSARLMRVFYKFVVPGSRKADAKDAFNHFYSNMPKMKTFVLPTITAILAWLCIYTSTYFIMLSLGMNIPYHMFVTGFPIATLVGLIPITISGWGTREATLIGLLSVFGVLASEIIAMSILTFVLSSVIPSIIGAALSFKEN